MGYTPPPSSSSSLPFHVITSKFSSSSGHTPWVLSIKQLALSPHTHTTRHKYNRHIQRQNTHTHSQSHTATTIPQRQTDKRRTHNHLTAATPRLMPSLEVEGLVLNPVPPARLPHPGGLALTYPPNSSQQGLDGSAQPWGTIVNTNRRAEEQRTVLTGSLIRSRCLYKDCIEGGSQHSN